ncbi:MAG: recombinase family protein, partial [Actinomycetota bacterium]|nr:recombinase family protein [Actinomycetota bacterium]
MAYVMHSGMSDVFARMYIEDLKEKTMRGKRGKAHEGKVVGNGPAPYGFRYTHNEKGTRVGLEVEPPEMAVVRRLFELVGKRGMPMYSAGRTLEGEGHPAPKGGGWRVGVIHNILKNDIYKEHTYEEVAGLVAPGVMEKLSLDEDERYG